MKDTKSVYVNPDTSPWKEAMVGTVMAEGLGMYNPNLSEDEQAILSDLLTVGPHRMVELRNSFSSGDINRLYKGKMIHVGVNGIVKITGRGASALAISDGFTNDMDREELIRRYAGGSDLKGKDLGKNKFEKMVIDTEGKNEGVYPFSYSPTSIDDVYEKDMRGDWWKHPGATVGLNNPPKQTILQRCAMAGLALIAVIWLGRGKK